MTAALAIARDAGVALRLAPDGRLKWVADRPIDPALLSDLRAHRDGIVTALLKEAWPAHLLVDPAEVVLRGELAEIERKFDNDRFPY
jgi:hypothetical protein